VIEDRSAIKHRFAVVEDQYGYTNQGIVSRNRLGITENAPWIMFG
jgi:hypothetical protein